MAKGARRPTGPGAVRLRRQESELCPRSEIDRGQMQAVRGRAGCALQVPSSLALAAVDAERPLRQHGGVYFNPYLILVAPSQGPLDRAILRHESDVQVMRCSAAFVAEHVGLWPSSLVSKMRCRQVQTSTERARGHLRIPTTARSRSWLESARAAVCSRRCDQQRAGPDSRTKRRGASKPRSARCKRNLHEFRAGVQCPNSR